MASAAALGFSQADILKLKEVLAQQTSCTYPSVPVVYLTGQGCSGCVTSLLNRVVDVAGGYYDADMVNALYTNALGLPPTPHAPVGQGTPNDPVPELNAVMDVADLLVGDGVGTLVPQLQPRTGWAPYPNGYITNVWNTTVMASAGWLPVGELVSLVEGGGPFVLLVEGAIPKRKQGRFCWVFDNADKNGASYTGNLPAGPVTAKDAFLWMASRCAFIINVGTCSSFGGIPAGKALDQGFPQDNVTLAKPTYKWLKWYNINTPYVNVPGCPPHPDWIIYPVAFYLINSILPALDAYNRPQATYGAGQSLCSDCSKFDNYDPATAAQQLGDPGCTKYLGCKGMYAHATCPKRGWNSADEGTKMNFCVGWQTDSPNPMVNGIGDARHVCQGCVEWNFPDGMSPFYEEK